MFRRRGGVNSLNHHQLDISDLNLTAADRATISCTTTRIEP